jgi:imidazolonepropionase-like amidohydrolase
MRVALSFILLMILSFPAHSQGGNVVVQDMNGVAGVYAIRSARIVTVSGPVIENGTVVIRDGKIEAVGANVAVPAGSQEIDARGLSIYPGMIDLSTSIGLVEIGSGAPGTVDTAETGDMNPNAVAMIALNPHSAHIPVTRIGGVTTVLSIPIGNIISGQASLINLRGSTPLEMTIVPSAALAINFPRVSTVSFDALFNQQDINITEAIKTRDTQLEQLRKILREAAAYGTAKDAYARDKNLPRPVESVVLAALVPFVRGQRPVLFRVNREVDIRAAVNFAIEMKLRPIIIGGNDAWKVANFLKQHNVPVVITGVWDLPANEDDYYDVLYSNAAKLQKAGVRFCISAGDSAAQVHDLPFQAGMAAAFGLPHDEALKAVTLYPAEILGVADRMGSIDAGKVANLVITDGDLLEARTHVRYLFIEGRLIPLVTRQTQLYEEFKDRK